MDIFLATGYWICASSYQNKVGKQLAFENFQLLHCHWCYATSHRHQKAQLDACLPGAEYSFLRNDFLTNKEKKASFFFGYIYTYLYLCRYNLTTYDQYI